jgi:hypothetical protein
MQQASSLWISLNQPVHQDDHGCFVPSAEAENITGPSARINGTTLSVSKFSNSCIQGDKSMRKLIFTCIAATLVTAPMVSVVKAEDTTVIKRDRDGDKTVIKKRENLNVLPVPHTEEKTIIKKERE